MTASTPRHREHRDPSPTKVRKIPISRTQSSDDVEEPWDERSAPRRTSSGVMGLVEGAGEIMTNCFAKTDEDGLEDGDLPSLSRPKSRPRAEQRLEEEDEPPSLLGSKRSTTRRPLNPPAQAGGMSVEERRLAAIRNRDSPGTAEKRSEFFRQLDPPTPSDTEKTFEDEPDDEAADRRQLVPSSQRRQYLEPTPDRRQYLEPSYSDIDSPQRNDEVVDEYGSYENIPGATSAEEVSCFDSALTSITQICGYGDDPKVSTRDQRWTEPHGDSWIDIDEKQKEEDENAVEQTAIEVEYVAVEEDQEQAKGKGKKGNKKNSYLSALARKAKKDFDEKAPEANKEAGGGAVVVVPTTAGGEPQDKSVEDVYSSFNPTERRKFLNLINSGMSSKEASNKVLSDRDDGGDKKKKKSLSFRNMFKRGKSEKPSNEFHPVGIAIDRSLDSVDSSTAEGYGEEAHHSPSSSFEGDSSTPIKRAPPNSAELAQAVSPRPSNYTGDPSTSIDSGENDHGTPYSDSRSAPPPQIASTDPYRAYNMAVANSPLAGTYDEDDGAVFVSSASESGDSDDEGVRKQEKRNKAAAIALGAGAAGAVVAAGTAAAIATSYSGESGNSGPFQRSGNNYYDAVRKEVPEDDEDYGSEDAARQAPKGSKLSSMRSSPRMLGFKSLKNQGDDDGNQFQYDSGVGEHHPSKRRLRGLPVTPNGFEALEDQQYGQLSKNTMSEDIEEEMRKMEAEYDNPETEDEAIGKIERNLLRPGPVSVDDLPDNDDYGQNDTSYDLATPRAMAEAEASPTQRIEVAGDLNLDNYFDSTVSYASPGPPTHDQASVISGKSEWTARTGYTGASTVHTQSSRKRHKGAAKKRIAKARAAEKASKSRKNGWHESIVAAAASTNRVWDPQKGWVDYEDPDSVTHEAKSTEKLRISLDGVKMRSGDVGRDSEDRPRSRPVDVSFPPEWERERNEMTQDGYASPTSNVNAAPRSVDPTDSEDEGVEADADEWVESMREATAGIERDGQKWDPKVGWVSTEGDGDDQTPAEDRSRNVPTDAKPTEEYSAEEVVDDKTSRGMPPDVNESSLAEERYPNAAKDVTIPTEERSGSDAEATSESNMRSLGMPPKSPEITSNRDALETFIENSAVPTTSRQSELSTGGSDQAVASSGGMVAKMGAPESSGSESANGKDPSLGSVGTSKDSVSEAPPNKYVQLGDNGSVRSTFAQEQLQQSQIESQQGERAKSTERDAKSDFAVGAKQAELYTKSSSEAGANDAAFFVSAPLFAESDRRQDDRAPLLQADKDMSYSSDIRKAPQVNVVKQKCDEEDLNLFSGDDFDDVGNLFDGPLLSPPPKDRSGPVDVDDLDTNVDAVKTQSVDTHDPSRQMENFESPKVSDTPIALGTPPAPSRSSSNASRSGKKTTPVPKLGKNKRDTSPLSQRKTEAPVSAKQAQSRNTDTIASLSSQPDSESQQTPAGDESVTSSVKERLQQWESRSGGKSAGHPDPPSNDGKRSISGGRHDTNARSITPDVEAEALEWPGDSSEPTEVEEGQNVPAEWKSFFGKKVRAESSAAMQAQSQGEPKPPKYVSADDADEYIRPDEGSYPRKRSEPSSRWKRKGGDDDSLFDFEKAHEGVRRGSRSAPRDFPNISPIHTQDEDDVVMEEVESNTGAVNKDSTFFQRLSTCAAPMMPSQLTKSCDGGASVPMSSFLRSGSSKNGSIDEVITEENEDGSKSRTSRSTRSSKLRRESPRAIGSEVRSSSSVASEDFGQKTAYLEAIAMKAAVSNPKRSGSSGRRRSPGSDISSTSRSSEKWRAFIEKKKAAGVESSSKSNTDVSRAAEKYAAEKVEEMISVLSSRSRSAPKSRDDEPGDDAHRGGISSSASQSQRGNGAGRDRPVSAGRVGRKSESAKAAEELAAARVEAMMAALSSKSLDEGEI